MGGDRHIARANNRSSELLHDLSALLRERLQADPSVDDGEFDDRVAALWRDILETLPPRRHPNRIADATRRVIDVVAASMLLMLSAPLIAALAWRVKRCDGGPAFFRHRRLTRDGREFFLWKIRTMRVDAPRQLSTSNGWAEYVANDFKIPDSDTRVTDVGRLLRKNHLDELPQLWNVIRGDLSLVGPRPVIRAELVWWGPQAEELLSAKPGLFGAWQLTDHLSYPSRAYLELAYVRRRSLRLDVEILARSFLNVILSRSFVMSDLMPITPRSPALESLEAPIAPLAGVSMQVHSTATNGDVGPGRDEATHPSEHVAGRNGRESVRRRPAWRPSTTRGQANSHEQAVPPSA
jgi:lipopolysaccharide/colanic/teichoic acid biosynthesis glycosyltransferase